MAPTVRIEPDDQLTLAEAKEQLLRLIADLNEKLSDIRDKAEAIRFGAKEPDQK